MYGDDDKQRENGGSRRAEKKVQRVQDAGDSRGLVVEQVRPVQLNRFRGAARVEDIEHILGGGVCHRLSVRNLQWQTPEPSARRNDPDTGA